MAAPVEHMAEACLRLVYGDARPPPVRPHHLRRRHPWSRPHPRRPHGVTRHRTESRVGILTVAAGVPPRPAAPRVPAPHGRSGGPGGPRAGVSCRVRLLTPPRRPATSVIAGGRGATTLVLRVNQRAELRGNQPLGRRRLHRLRVRIRPHQVRVLRCRVALVPAPRRQPHILEQPALAHLPRAAPEAHPRADRERGPRPAGTSSRSGSNHSKILPGPPRSRPGPYPAPPAARPAATAHAASQTAPSILHPVERRGREHHVEARRSQLCRLEGRVHHAQPRIVREVRAAVPPSAARASRLPSPSRPAPAASASPPSGPISTTSGAGPGRVQPCEEPIEQLVWVRRPHPVVDLRHPVEGLDSRTAIQLRIPASALTGSAQAATLAAWVRARRWRSWPARRRPSACAPRPRRRHRRRRPRRRAHRPAIVRRLGGAGRPRRDRRHRHQRQDHDAPDAQPHRTRAGLAPLHNRSGANLMRGVAADALPRRDVDGRMRARRNASRPGGRRSDAARPSAAPRPARSSSSPTSFATSSTATARSTPSRASGATLAAARATPPSSSTPTTPRSPSSPRGGAARSTGLRPRRPAFADGLSRIASTPAGASIAAAPFARRRFFGRVGHWRCPAAAAPAPRPDMVATRVAHLDGAASESPGSASSACRPRRALQASKRARRGRARARAWAPGAQRGSRAGLVATARRWAARSASRWRSPRAPAARQARRREQVLRLLASAPREGPGLRVPPS